MCPQARMSVQVCGSFRLHRPSTLGDRHPPVVQQRSVEGPVRAQRDTLRPGDITGSSPCSYMPMIYSGKKDINKHTQTHI